MLLWIIVAIILAVFSIVEILLNFTIPFIELRAVILFLLVLGMSYRIYLMGRGGEKENLKQKVRELEDKIRELEIQG